MLRLDVKEIIELIQAGKTFEATANDNSFEIKINKYVPYCCMAIHDGSNFRQELKAKINLDEYNRWYEEDPYTGTFISSMPITLIGKDSRYEYDLNRPPSDAIYDTAWGEKVWKTNLSTKEKQTSLLKHHNFYKVVHALIQKIEETFNGCVVYDIHSYNHKRWDREVPLFNIGTERVNKEKFDRQINQWLEELSKIEIPDVKNSSKENDVFFGKGYNLEYITTHFNNTLVLATEIKKVYCNELSGEAYPKIIKSLQENLKLAILNHANFFSQNCTNWKYNKTAFLLDKKMDKDILKVDKGLYHLLKNFELLAYVNPNNSNAEQKKFFKAKYRSLPKFKYSPIRINSFELKQELSKLPVQNISDVSIRSLYESVINSYFDKIDLLSTLNTPKFLYNSLRYFGRPSKKDLHNAHYLLHLPPVPGEPNKSPSINTKQAIEIFKKSLKNYGFECKIELSNKVISQVMVLNAKKTIQFNPDALFTEREINALVEHEIGVHMVTTTNSNLQQLKLFNMGLPVNTRTQEGLAILSEYLSGNLTIKRLKKLAYRVIVTDMMCNGADFIECFHFLHQNHIADPNEAYSIVTRIFRGGGFTKDYLYLSGFAKILHFWQNNSLEPLLIGKTSLEFYSILSEMIEREMIQKPKYLTQSFIRPKLDNNNPIYDYILSGLK